MTINIIYSSGGGNTKLVVDTVSEVLTTHDIQVKQIPVINADPTDIIQHQITILAAPTYDHGVLHAPYERWIANIEQTSTLSLATFHYAIIGLGDDKYDKEYNIESVPLLESFVQQRGGTIIIPSLSINKSPVGQLDTVTIRATGLVHAIQH